MKTKTVANAPICLSFLLALASYPFIGQSHADEVLPRKRGFVVTPLSYKLREQNVGATIRFASDNSIRRDIAVAPSAYRLAEMTGYLIVLRKPTAASDVPAYQKVRAEFIKSGYIASPRRFDRTSEFLIPRAFLGSPDELDTFLDGLATEEIIEYLFDWEDNESGSAVVASENNTLRERERSANETLTFVNDQRTKYQAENEELQRHITRVQAEIQILNQRLSGQNFLALRSNRTRLSTVLNTPETPARKVKPNPEKDFFVPVIQSNMTSIAEKPYDGPQVSQKYLQPELVEALDSFTEQESETLRELGLSPFTLASGARSPLQQAGLSNPVASGMFSSGHVYGVATDISMQGGTSIDLKPYYHIKAGTGIPVARPQDLQALDVPNPRFSRNPKIAAQQRAALAQYRQNRNAYKNEYKRRSDNWKKLGQAMARHGLMLRLPFDPNHVDLAKFRQDKKYANGIRVKMLSGYYNAMQSEREAQLLIKEKLKGEQRDLNTRIQRLDQQISAAQNLLNAAKAEKARLDAENTKAHRELDLIRKAVASQQAAKERSNGRQREIWREVSREREQPGKERYWERYSREEIHSREADRDCLEVRESRQNSRGEWRNSISIECRPSASERGMSRLP